MRSIFIILLLYTVRLFPQLNIDSLDQIISYQEYATVSSNTILAKVETFEYSDYNQAKRVILYN